MIKILAFSTVLLLVAACSPFSNELDRIALDCGTDALSFQNATFLLPVEVPDAAPDAWQGIAWSASTTNGTPLARTSRGCLVVSARNDAEVYLRHGSAKLGARVSTQELRPTSLTYVSVRPEASELEAKSLTIACQPNQSNGFALPLALRYQAAPQLHHYDLAYALFSAAQPTIPMSSGSVPLDGSPLVLPKTLADGAFLIRYRLTDSFESAYDGVPAQTLDCPLTLDTHPPELQGISEELATLGLGPLELKEVAPGQTVNIKVSDPSPEIKIYWCSAQAGQDPCEDFTLLSRPYTAPEEGMHKIRYYAVDAAGNRTATAELPTLAVVHREIMQNAATELLLARSESDQFHKIEANLHWLKANELYATLTLSLEKEELSEQIGITYSEIAKEQSVRGRFFDHNAAIVQLLEIPASPPNPAAFASLDAGGFLSIRSFAGAQLATERGVVSLALHPRWGLIIQFDDASLQLGLKGPRLALPSGFQRPQFSVDAKDDLIFAWEKNEYAILRTSLSGLSTIARRQLDFEPQAIGREGDLLVVGGKKKVASFLFADGQPVAEQSWDEHCILGELTNAGSFGWFIALRYDYNESGYFDCNLYGWNAREPWKEIDPNEVHDPMDLDFPADDFKFKGLRDLRYLPARQWLLMSRSGFDSTLGILDLNTRRMRFIRPQSALGENKGETTALVLSADGNFLADASYVAKYPGTPDQIEIRLWDLRLAEDSDFSYEKVLVKRIVEPSLEATALAIDPESGRFVAAIKGRELRLSSITNSLVPEFKTEVPSAFSLSAPADQLLLRGDSIERRDRFGKLLLAMPLPTPDGIAALTFDAGSAPLALDVKGRLWEVQPDTHTWKLVFASDLRVPPLRGPEDAEGRERHDLVLLPSPDFTQLLVVGRDAAGAEQSLILAKKDGTWSQSAQWPAAPKYAAWNAQGSHLGVVEADATRLIRADGAELTRRPYDPYTIPSLTYLPFSDEGSRWLVSDGATIEIFDIPSQAYIGPPASTPRPFQYLAFKDGSRDRLWMSASNSILEIDARGEIIRDYGAVENEPFFIFMRRGAVWIFDSNARILKLNENAERPSVLISNERGAGGVIAGRDRSASFILVEGGLPMDIPSFTFLHLNAAPQLVAAMCAWMEPLLQAAQNAEIGKAARFCSLQGP